MDNDTPDQAPSRLDHLQARLYSKTNQPHRSTRSRLSSESGTTKREFSPLPEPPKPLADRLPPSLFKKIFMGSLIFFGVAALFAAFMWWHGNTTVSSDRIEINVLGNSFVEGGEELALQVEVANKNRAALDLADLVVSYVKSNADETSNASSRISIGTIEGGKSVVVPVAVTLYGGEGSTQAVDFSLEYRIAGSNSIFVKNETHQVTLSSSPILVFVDAPESTPPNQMISLDITLKHEAANVAQNIGVLVEYPFGFEYRASTPEPVKGNNVFSLGDLPEGGEQTIHIEGMMYGEIGEDRAFRIYAGSLDPGNETALAVTYTSLVHTLTLAKPFLEATLTYDGATGDTFIVAPNKNISASIDWSNNLPLRMNNVELRVSLSGNAFDPSSVVPANGGFYDSLTHSIVWSGSKYKDFTVVEPGEQGTVTFSFVPASTNILSPSVSASISIKGNQSSSGNTPEEVSTIETKTWNISTDLRLSSRVLHSTGAIANTGPLPPRVGQETTYTVVWDLTNTSNVASDAIVRATLPLYVSWKGVRSPTSENVLYNENTREVTWTPGTIAAGVGNSTPPREVSFQVGITPSSSQVNSSPTLLEKATLSARDSFTNALLSGSWGALSTRLSTETGSGAAEWSVKE